MIHSVQSPVTDPRGAVHVKFRLKAYAATDDVTERRMMIHGGGRGSPLPSEDAAFHISQVLPWIWLDEAVRTQMGLPGQLSAVIVAPSRRYVLLDNLREVAIVGAVALGGVAASLGGVWRDVCGILAVVLPLMLIGLRVRSKLR